MAAEAKVCLTNTDQMKAFRPAGVGHIIIAFDCSDGPQGKAETKIYRKFMDFLRTYLHLVTLDMGGPDISGHNCGIWYGVEFYDILEQNPSLKELKLRRLRDVSLTRLGRELKSHTCQLEYLKVTDYYYSDVKPIFRALKWNSSLKRFKYRANPRGNDGLEVEAEAVAYLARAKALKEFNCWDFLEMEDVELWERPELIAPLQALSKQTTLTKLKFGYFDVSEKVERPSLPMEGMEVEYQILLGLYRISRRLRKNVL